MGQGGEQFHFKIARLKYEGGGDWYSNPTSLPNLISFINQNSTINSENKTPNHQVGLHSMLDLPHGVEFDQHLYFISDFTPENSNKIDSYAKLDLRLGWQATDSLHLSLVGQNLLNDGHEEFSPFLYNPANQ
ncbi:MAG: DUF4159 domain-containing protein, partial [Bacteroidota bacterium]